MKNLVSLTALETVEGIKSKEFGASEVISALSSRIAAKEPEIKAWTYFDPQHATAQAQRLQDIQDTAAYPLLGVPVGVKDVIDTSDMPTENATVLDAGRQPLVDAGTVRLLRDAGAVIMGKTVSTELAYMQPSRTRNPHNTGHTPGGSSSGSAAAVAAGMVPVALGTQTNGSVIRPASFCGIYALKPTNGLFPRTGVLEESASFDVVGVFARSLEDVAAVSEVLASHSPADASVPPRGRPQYLGLTRSSSPSAPRFAFVKTPAWALAEEGTKETFLKLAESLKPQCDELQLPPEFDQAVSFHRTIMMAEIALNFGRYYEKDKANLSAPLQQAVELGRTINAAEYLAALRARESLYQRLAGLLEPYDAIITPPAAGPAPEGNDSTGNPVFCTLWTYLGTPALNLPVFQVRGLPLGLQLVGRRFGEGQLFQSASALLKLLNAKGYSTTVKPVPAA